MAFIFDTNIFVTGGNAAIAMFHLKQLLKLAGWTVPTSSDGLTYNPSGDQITTQGSGAGGMDNVNAWFVIQSPDGHSWAFQRGLVPNLNSQDWWILVSRAAGFVGGTPDVATPPTATDAGLVVTPDVSNFSIGQGSSDIRYNIAAEDVAPYRFWASPMSIRDNQHGYGTLMMDSLAPTVIQAIDPDPFVYLAGYDGYDLWAFGYSQGGMANERFVRYSQIKFYDPWSGNYAFPGDDGSSGSGSNLYNGKDDLAIVVYAVGGERGHGAKGVSSMMRQVSNARTMGTVIGRATPGDSLIVGKLGSWLVTLPWNGTLPRRDV